LFRQRAPYRVVGDLANSDLVINQTFWIGMYPHLAPATLYYVLEAFARFSRQFG
jgi:dTDP-4-amino-4,6-dideoxygalactose transaminase